MHAGCLTITNSNKRNERTNGIRSILGMDIARTPHKAAPDVTRFSKKPSSALTPNESCVSTVLVHASLCHYTTREIFTFGRDDATTNISDIFDAKWAHRSKLNDCLRSVLCEPHRLTSLNLCYSVPENKNIKNCTVTRFLQKFVMKVPSKTFSKNHEIKVTSNLTLQWVQFSLQFWLQNFFWGGESGPCTTSK